ncbi:CTD kinase subunit gamma CTK3-domain-containing protein [Chytriomyces cf. hyalinus JEL632]|nr:CTD kinase subunit gamma CTK3-domain-containing protein [Chytriomyces cf. hyalinus JEL632]
MSDDDSNETIDGFECRAQFKELLGTVTSSQQIVQRVSDYAVRASVRPHAAIMYACIRERLAATPTLNRLHLLYVIDAICHKSARIKHRAFIDMVERELNDIMRLVVPDANPVNAAQVLRYLARWKAKALFPESELTPIETRINALSLKAASIVPEKTFTKSEIMKRIEEDRDRHKKQREEGWHRGPDPSATLSSSGDGEAVKKSRKSVRKDEFEEAWAKIDALTIDGDFREWDAMSTDLKRFDAEHDGYI